MQELSSKVSAAAEAVRRWWGESPLREPLGAALCAVVLLWINVYICRDLFSSPATQTNSMQGSWIALAMRAGSSWFHATWWPYWDGGGPFEFTYAPLVPGLTAAWSVVGGIPYGVAFHSVMGLFYCLAPLTLFLTAWRLTRAVLYSFVAALVYSLIAITQILVPDTEFGLTKIWDARRLLLVMAWDETPHLAAVALLPLVILFLARSIETRRKRYYAATALSIAAMTLASAFGPVMAVMAAVCLLVALGREHWLSNAILTIILGAWGWAIAAPFLSPSLMTAIREANARTNDADARWTPGSLTALALLVMGWAILWRLARRWQGEPWLRFVTLFGYLTSAILIVDVVFHRHFLPQPGRYWMEMEVAMSLAVTFLARKSLTRAPKSIAGALLFLLLALAVEQTIHYRQEEKRLLKRPDLASSVEYQASVWVKQNLPGVRVFLPGSIAQWANAFADVPQFAGGSFTMSTNLAQRLGKETIFWDPDPSVALLWLKAYGAGAIGISESNSKEFWHPFAAPAKLEAVMQPLWREDGVVICRVPVRETALAHVVPEAAIMRAGSQFGENVVALRNYVAALDDGSLPLTQFAWEGRNRIRVRTTVGSGQVVSVQVSYHAGWHAASGGRKLRIRKDGLGLMWMNTGCLGPCEVQMDYDGGWELRICRWISWLALAGVGFVGLWPRKR